MGAPRLSEQLIATICEKAAAGLSYGVIGEAVGMSRNAVTGLVFRLRQRGDPRLPAARPSIATTAVEERNALAAAFADGAATLEDAARTAGLSLMSATNRWNEIRAQLGWQAR